MKLLAALVMLLRVFAAEDFWGELRQLALRSSPEFAEQSWVYSVQWQGEFQRANQQLLNYYANRALSPASRLPVAVALARDETSGFVLPESLPQLRRYLNETGHPGFLNIIVKAEGARIVMICQVINQDSALDRLFSAETPVSAEISLMLQGSRVANGSPDDSLIQRLFVEDDLLAVAAGELGFKAAEELAVLTEKELMIFSLENDRFDLATRVSLRSLRSSYYPNRRVSGRLYYLTNGNGSARLLINANRFRNGAIFIAGSSPELTAWDAQPLPAVISTGDDDNYFRSQYVPGEDNRSVVAPLGVSRSSLPGTLMFRDYLPIRGAGGTAVTLSRDRRLFLLNFESSTIQEVETGNRSIKRIFDVEARNGELFVWLVENPPAGAESGQKIVLLQPGDSPRTHYELSSQLDIIDAALYNSGGNTPELIIAGKTANGACVIERHRLPAITINSGQ